MIEIFERLTELLRQGKTVAMASILSTSGSTPRAPGTRMLVTADGETFLSIGGGGLEAAVIDDAKKAIAAGKNVIKEYGLSKDGPGSVGMICGGVTTVVIDVVSPPRKLMVFGAGHVGRAVVDGARGLGFSVAVIDDRPEYLEPDRFPDGVVLRLTNPDYDRDIPETDENTYIVIATRSHDTDLKALRYALRGESAYVGMLGSRKKVRELFRRLNADGVSSETLGRVRAPIGLDIGSKTPSEVAISILAEIIRVKNGLGAGVEPLEEHRP